MEVLILIILLIIILIVIDKISVYPFVKGFRFINKLDKKHVYLGPYKDVVKNVNESRVVQVKVEKYPSARVTFYTPNYNFDKLPVIIFIHGGGWVGGSSKKISLFTKLLASKGYVVASVDYSLAPEYPYPISTYQLVEVLNHIYEKADEYKIDKTKIFIGGTSAGAHLSSQLGCLVSNKKYADEVLVNVKVPNSCIKGLILINGVYNFETVGKCKFMGMKHFLWAYLNKKKYNESLKLSEVSTIKHITKDYPSVFITAGDRDPLKTQSYEFVDGLNRNKISYKDVFFRNNKLKHDFIYRLDNVDSRFVYEEIINFLDSSIK